MATSHRLPAFLPDALESELQREKLEPEEGLTPSTFPVKLGTLCYWATRANWWRRKWLHLRPPESNFWRSTIWATSPCVNAGLRYLQSPC